MNLRRLIYTFSLFAVLALASQDFLAEDLNVTVTHPSVFHDELREHKVTMQADENNPMIRRKAHKPLNLSELISNYTSGKPLNLTDIDISSDDSSSEDYSDDTSCSSDFVTEIFDNVANKTRRYFNYNAERFSNFSGLNMTRHNASNEYYSEGTSDDTGLCSSDFTSEGTSDSDEKILSALIGAAKDLQKKVTSEANRQLRLTKLQAKRNWEALKYKIIREAQAAEIPKEEIKEQIKNAKREVRSAWRDFKWKVKNGADILDELLENTDPLNPNVQNRGNTEPANDTYRPIF